MKDLISIIINVYNEEKYIKRCIDCVINQTYKNLEIIIVNDGSIDGTKKIISSYKDRRIKVINQDNMGLSLSRNVGIESSSGKYLFFIDADDFMEFDTIEYLYSLCKKNKSKLATCECLEVYDDKKKNIKNSEVIKIESGKDMVKKVLLSSGKHGTIWNKLIHRDLFENLRFENRIINDVVVVYKLFLSTDNIVYSNKIKYYYFRHSNSIISKREVNRTKDLYKASLERYYNLKKIYPSFVENELCMLFMIIDIYYHDYDKLKDYLKEEKVKKTYNNIFSLKLLKSNIDFDDKIKLVLFRISPLFTNFVTKLYIKK